MDRRRFVKITGVAAAAGVTGCLGGNGDDGEDGEDGEDGDGENGDGNGGAETYVGQDGNATDMTGQDEVEVSVGAGPNNYKFDPADIVVDAGTTVRWVWTGEGQQHNVVEADGTETLSDPSFASDLASEEGNEFTHTFEEAGTYDYVCEPHVTSDMIGSVEVVEGEGGSSSGENGGESGGNETDGGMNGGMNETDGGSGNETSGNESM